MTARTGEVGHFEPPPAARESLQGHYAGFASRFAAFAVDPGSHPSDVTTITVTYYDVVGTDGQLAAFETFRLRRPRRD